MVATTVRWAVMGLGLSLFAGTPVSADIYRYVDREGIWHFTNIKTDGRYRLYVRTTRQSPSEYIEKYEDIIQQAAKRFGVDNALIKAVIKAESDFNYRAVSRKGAQGLMQLMPETADDMGVGNPFNPEENIFGGTRYLSLLLKRFKNNMKFALAAYNAGPEQVETHQGIPPFTETRTFVQKVMDYYRMNNGGGK